jgi:hypothetical protein
MKLNTLLSINSVLILIYSVGALFIPNTMLTMYGMTHGASEQLMTRYFGASLLTLGLMSWLMRNSRDTNVQRAIILAFLVFDAAGMFVSLLGTISAVMSPLGWQVVTIFLLLGICFGYFQLAKPKSIYKNH